jgi:hypothetical protein
VAVKLGSTDVSFRLGATTPAKVYLGSAEVWSAGPATLYFNAAVDSDWTTAGNWWLDAEHTQAAGRLPAESENVIVTGSITASGQTVANAEFTNFVVSASLDGSLTVTGLATFKGDDCALAGTLTGSALFTESSANAGTVTGTATFSDSAVNCGGTAGTFVPDPPPSC